MTKAQEFLFIVQTAVLANAVSLASQLTGDFHADGELRVEISCTGEGLSRCFRFDQHVVGGGVEAPAIGATPAALLHA